MIAVTTFHPRAGETYAKEMLQSLIGKFDGRIISYIEEHPSWSDTRIEWRDLYSIPGINEFLERLKNVEGANGFVEGSFDFRFNANVFCRKVFVQDHVFDEDEIVIWFDSDCVFNKEFPAGFFEDLLKDVPFAYMGRAKTYSETGFVGFNTSHKDFQTFREKYLSYYTTGKIFTQMVGWHDCIAFDYASQGLKGNNLSPKGTGYDHVLKDTVLSPYMHHKKGMLKHE